MSGSTGPSSGRQPRPRLSTSDRRALFAVGIQFFVNGAAMASFASRSPELRDQIGVTVSTFGVLLTVVGVMGLLGSVAVGHIVHRFGTQRVLTVGALSMAALLPAIGSAGAPWVLVLAMGAYFFADVMVDISMNLQGSWISARRRIPVMNRLHGLWSLGTVAGGAAAAQAAAAGLSLVAHLTLAALTVALLLVVVARRLLAVDEDEHADAPQRRSTQPVRSHRTIYTLLAFAGGFAIVMEQTGLDWSTFRLSDDFGASATTAALAYVAFTGGMAVSRVGGDQVQAWLGLDRLHWLSVGLATVGTAVATLVPNRWLVLAGYTLAGAGVAIFMPKLYDEAARAPGRRGAGLGMMNAGMRTGALLSPAVIGAIAGTSLSVGTAVAIVALPSVVGYAIATHLVTGRRS